MRYNFVSISFINIFTTKGNQFQLRQILLPFLSYLSFLLHTMAENANTNHKDEDPFDLIHKGNAFASSSSHWSAADAYSRASLALRHRADALLQSCINTATSSTKELEVQKIMALYNTQSTEYFYKARHSLLQAMSFENEQDRNSTHEKTDPTCSFIGIDEAERRRRLFDRLFVMQHNAVYSTKPDGNMNMPAIAPIENECANVNSIIDIPAAPSSSLPTIDDTLSQEKSTLNDNQCNTSEQRLDEIRNGLQRLGVSLQHNEHESRTSVHKELSSEDQVKLIIQQATDEVQVERSSTNDEYYNDSDVDENDSMFEGYDQLDVSDDYDLDTLLVKVEKIVASAASKEGAETDGFKTNDEVEQYLQMIRDAQALLLEARLSLELERESCPNGSDDSLSSLPCHNKSLDRSHRAIERIRGAICCLQKGLGKLGSR